MQSSNHTDFGLDTPFEVTAKQIRFFRENGFIKLQNVLSAEILEKYRREINHKVFELNNLHNVPMAERDTYQKAFLQVINLWRYSEIVKEFVFSKRMAQIATDLLEVSGVRLYHDQALYKEPGGGFTPWHADQYYWPLASEKCCTIWVPLQHTNLDMGPLYFAAQSHRFAEGRNLKISDESEEIIAQLLKKAQFEIVQEPFELGEVSFHFGWTFHRAGPNTTAIPREVMTVIYMDEAMHLKQPENDNQKLDAATFCPGINAGELVNSPLNPILFSRN